MNSNDESRRFFQDTRPSDDQLFVEVPADWPSPYPDKIPNGYDPMGEIYLRGRASRNFASGSIPWWVLIVGWLFLGGGVLFVLMVAFATASPGVLVSLFVPAIFMMILGRGTSAKLYKRRRSRRGRRW